MLCIDLAAISKHRPLLEMNQVGGNPTTAVAIGKRISLILISIDTQIIQPVGELPPLGNATTAIAIG
jgi:hypothetical protein